MGNRERTRSCVRVERRLGALRITLELGDTHASAEALEIAAHAAANAASGVLEIARDLGVGDDDDRGSCANVERA